MVTTPALARVLKKFVGPGAELHLLGTNTTLRNLFAVSPKETIPDAGFLVRLHLTKQIGCFRGAQVLDGRWIEEGDLQESWLELLRLGAYDKLAEIRRGNVIVMLEMNCSLDKWRKKLEYELMLILAHHMTNPPKHQS